MILPVQKQAAKVAIYRLGEDVNILQPGGATTDAYGKLDGSETFTAISSEKAVRTYTSSTQPNQARVAGGRYRTDSPTLLFWYDSAVQEGFRARIGVSEYEIDSLTAYPTHFEASTTVVN